MCVRPSKRARGFVLPTTLLVLTLLTVMLTAAFMLVSAEFRTTDNSFGNARALSLAQAGLQSYFAQPRNLTATSTYDSMRITLSGGYADVVARRVVPASSSKAGLWVVRSDGYATGPVLTGQTQGRRTIAQLAELNPGTLTARAAMVAANGVQITSSGNNPLDGRDATACNPGKDTTGLTTASGGYTSTPGSDPTGGIEYFSASAVNDSTHVNWASLVAGNFTPDYIVPAWPSDFSSYPAGLANGNVTLTGTKKGLLVVTGDVTLAAGMRWDGIIIAGGKLDANVNGGFTINGMVITGLNLSLGQTVAVNQVRKGATRFIRWASCYVTPTINSLSALVPMRNAWIDGWNLY